MKFKEYIAEKIIKFVLGNSSLDEMAKRITELEDRIDKVYNRVLECENLEGIEPEVIRLKDAVSMLENKMNQKYNSFNREIQKLKPPTINMAASEPSLFKPEDQVEGHPVRYKDYRINERRNRRR